MLPLISVQSPSFTITFYYNGKKVSRVSSGVVIRPYCLTPCKACTGAPNRCVNCMPLPNLLSYFDQVVQTCLNQCPSRTYPDINKVCQNCVPPCYTCDTSLDCASCVADTWLHNQRCIDPCPNEFYPGSNGRCIGCTPPCKNCRSGSDCLSCTTDFYSNFRCVPAASCPSGTYANTTTLICEPCAPPCSTCFSAEANCTACIAPKLYYDNKCEDVCLSTMYQSGNSCFNCVGLCSTCRNASYCNSCTSNYLSDGACLLAANCPSNTFPDTT
jgi:hypothetical protein